MTPKTKRLMAQKIRVLAIVLGYLQVALMLGLIGYIMFFG